MKKGDKVKIPKTKSYGGSYDLFRDEIATRGWSFLTVCSVVGEDNIHVSGPNGEYIGNDSFSINDIELYEEGIPKEWYIVWKNHEVFKTVTKHFGGIWIYYEGAKMDNIGHYYSKSTPSPKYTEITLEQFKKYVLKEQVMDKKIIGYKSPTDLFGQKVHKDEVFTRVSPHSDFYRGKSQSGDQYLMPREIVETWEPVYEEEFTEGDYVTLNELGISDLQSRTSTFDGINIIKEISGDYLYFKGLQGAHQDRKFFRRATPEEIKVHNTIMIGGYEATFGAGLVKFGCQTFSVGEIQAYKRLYGHNIYGSITINGTPVTLDTINKILRKIS